MKKETNKKKAVVVRVGELCTDGKRGGRILAVSGEDVAIEWDDGEVEQRTWAKMEHLHASDKLPRSG